MRKIANSWFLGVRQQSTLSSHRLLWDHPGKLSHLVKYGYRSDISPKISYAIVRIFCWEIAANRWA